MMIPTIVTENEQTQKKPSRNVHVTIVDLGDNDCNENFHYSKSALGGCTVHCYKLIPQLEAMPLQVMRSAQI